jgi:hypothetical protein
LSTRKSVMRGDGAYHHEKLGLERILCASQFTIPDKAGTSPNLACNNTVTWSSQSNHTRSTPHFSVLLISSISFSSPSPNFYLPIHNSNVIAEHTVMSSLAMSPFDDTQLILMTAYTMYDIHHILFIFPSLP